MRTLVKIDKRDPSVVRVVFHDVSGIPTYTARLSPTEARSLAMELVRRANDATALSRKLMKTR